MRKCPVCKGKFSKGKWVAGMFYTDCPYCNAHLKVAINWKCIPLVIVFILMGALCNTHYIFKIFTALSGFILWLYLCNLPYKRA